MAGGQGASITETTCAAVRKALASSPLHRAIRRRFGTEVASDLAATIVRESTSSASKAIDARLAVLRRR